MRRNARTLLRNRLLGNLHQHFLARLQQIADRRQVGSLHRVTLPSTRPRTRHSATITSAAFTSTFAAATFTRRSAFARSSLTRATLTASAIASTATAITTATTLAFATGVLFGTLSTSSHRAFTRLIEAAFFRKLLFVGFAFIAARKLFTALELVLLNVFFVDVEVVVLIQLIYRDFRTRNRFNRHLTQHRSKVRCTFQRLLFHLFVDSVCMQSRQLAILIIQQLFFQLAIARRKHLRPGIDRTLRLGKMHGLNRTFMLDRRSRLLRILRRSLKARSLRDQLARSLQRSELMLRRNYFNRSALMLFNILKRNLSQVLLRRALAELPRASRIDPEGRRSILFRLILRNSLVELHYSFSHRSRFKDLLMRFMRLCLQISLKRLRLIRRSIVAELLQRGLNIMLRRHRRLHSL